MHKKVVFLGDSLTSGDNNQGKSFVDYISGDFDIVKLGVSGTTMGEYSIYPVDGYSLLFQIRRHENAIKSADVIVLEYGVNDTTAGIVGNVSFVQELIAFVKAVDAITQLNPKAKLLFLSLSQDKKTLDFYALCQERYIETDYLYGYARTVCMMFEEWTGWYEKLISAIERKVEVIPMIDNKNWMLEYMDADDLHPTDEGYRLIADKVFGVLTGIL